MLHSSWRSRASGSWRWTSISRRPDCTTRCASARSVNGRRRCLGRGVVDYLLAANDGGQPERWLDYVVPVALPPGWEPEPSERAWKWWRDHTHVPWLLTFTFEPGGRLDCSIDPRCAST